MLFQSTFHLSTWPLPKSRKSNCPLFYYSGQLEEKLQPLYNLSEEVRAASSPVSEMPERWDTAWKQLPGRSQTCEVLSVGELILATQSVPDNERLPSKISSPTTVGARQWWSVCIIWDYCMKLQLSTVITVRDPWNLFLLLLLLHHCLYMRLASVNMRLISYVLTRGWASPGPRLWKGLWGHHQLLVFVSSMSSHLFRKDCWCSRFVPWPGSSTWLSKSCLSCLLPVWSMTTWSFILTLSFLVCIYLWASFKVFFAIFISWKAS